MPKQLHNCKKCGNRLVFEWGNNQGCMWRCPKCNGIEMLPTNFQDEENKDMWSKKEAEEYYKKRWLSAN